MASTFYVGIALHMECAYTRFTTLCVAPAHGRGLSLCWEDVVLALVTYTLSAPISTLLSVPFSRHQADGVLCKAGLACCWILVALSQLGCIRVLLQILQHYPNWYLDHWIWATILSLAVRLLLVPLLRFSLSYLALSTAQKDWFGALHSSTEALCF